MKKITVFILLAAMCASVFSGCTTGQAETTLPAASTAEETSSPATTEDTEDNGMINLIGKHAYSIVYDSNGSSAEINAAKQLQEYLLKLTGREFALVDHSAAVSPYEIIVGLTNREGKVYTLDRAGMKDEELRCFTADKSIVLLGEGTRGTLYAVFDFLEYLGCRFYSDTFEVIPTLDKTEIPNDYSVTESPAFEYRDIFQSCTFDQAIAVKLRLNGDVNQTRKLRPAWGSGITYAGTSFVHTFDSLVPPAKYFKTHPEYFSEINGKRNGEHLYTQLCLTNEEVYEIVLSGVRSWLDKNKTSKIVSVSQNDSYVVTSYCTCEKCKAINDYEQSYMGTLLRFVNRLADDLKEDYPDVAVDTLAYQYSVTPCKYEKPRDNVIVRYCTGACCAHPISKGSSGCTNVNFARNINTWANSCERIYIWDYTVNFAHYLCPFPNIHQVAESIKFYSQNNVKGVFMQGMYQEGESGGFGELRAFVMAKLLWDPTLEVEPLIEQFYADYYGEAGQYVKAYLDKISAVLEGSGKHYYIVDPADLFKGLLTDDDITELEQMWTDAKSTSAGTIYENHVLRSEIQWRYYKYCARLLEFKTSRASSTKKLWADCKALGVLRLNEGAAIQ